MSQMESLPLVNHWQSLHVEENLVNDASFINAEAKSSVWQEKHGWKCWGVKGSSHLYVFLANISADLRDVKNKTVIGFQKKKSMKW